MVRGLQERAARALPAEYVEEIDGWWLRHAPSCSWWVGTVLPRGDAEQVLPKVVEAEKFYAGRGATARFQVTPLACPQGLDTVLAERGYRRQSPVSLQIASTARVLDQPLTGSVRVRVNDRPTQEWFDVWLAVQGHGDTRAEWDLLGRVEGPSAYVSAMVGDEVVAVGRAVVDTGWAGVFGMGTLPQARGKGAARSVLAELAEWADAQAAEDMYLQVECDNVAALRLYERAGFSEICGYHYRA